MKIIAPSVEIMRSGLETDFMTPEQFIERVGRTCYKSEDKITEDSAAKFVTGLIKRGHEAMIEHWNLIFKSDVMWYEQFIDDYNMAMHNGNINLAEQLRSFLRFTDQTVNGQCRCIISGNMRAWRNYVEACVTGFGFIPQYLQSVVKNYPLFFPEWQDFVPKVVLYEALVPITVNDLVGRIEHDIHHDVTVKFICDRGVSHEIVRHRTSSFAQESTRYCNYSLDKFGKEITVIRPSWCFEGDAVYDIWKGGCKENKETYFAMLDAGASPQQARSALPSSLKTEVIMTTNLQGWDHFFFLRCATDAHPDIREEANMLYELFDEHVYTEEVLESIRTVNDFAVLDEVADD